MDYEIKRIRIWSAVKVGFVIWGALGFLLGLYMALMMPVMMKLLGAIAPLGDGAEMIGPAAFIVFPAVYALMGAVGGTIFTLIFVALYNLMASLLGGIEIELKDQTLRPIDIARIATPPIPGQSPDQKS